MSVGNYLICMVSDLLEEQVVESCFTTRYILLTIPNCTLKMVKLINFRLYVFYHNKKYTCIYKDQVELIEKNMSCSFFLSSHLLPSHSSFIFLKCDLHTVKFLSLVHSSTSFDKHKQWLYHQHNQETKQFHLLQKPLLSHPKALATSDLVCLFVCLSFVPIGLSFLASFT